MKELRRGPILFSLALLLPLGLAIPQPSRAQVRWQDLVFTGGLSAEGYRGNLTPVTRSCHRCATAPARGLFLIAVQYS